MPEFVLEGRDHAARAESPFVLGFIEAMFFTECSPAFDSAEWFTDEAKGAQEEGRADGTLPGDVGYSDIHPDSLDTIRERCQAFQAEAAELLAEAYQRPDYDETQAGRDYWFTVNGHGVGYWDRDQLKAGDLGQRLSEACGRREFSASFGEHADHRHETISFVHVDF